jgi:magnesium transporter
MTHHPGSTFRSEDERHGVHAFFYDARGLDRELELRDVVVEKLDSNTLLWIDVEARKELPAVAKLLGLEPRLSWEENLDRRPQLDNHGQYFSFSVDAAPGRQEIQDGSNGVSMSPRNRDDGSSNGSTVRTEFFVSKHWLVTVHDGDAHCLRRFREQDKADTSIGSLTGQMLAASLLDWHLGTFFDEVSSIDAAVDKLDDRVLRELTSKTLLGRMVTLRRRVSKLRGILVSQRDIFYGLSRADFVLVTDSDAAPFYEALVGRFERAVDEIERSRDVVVGSFELFTSRTSQQTNDLVKVLTFITAIVGFCAAIAGLMGMNFRLAFFETGLTGFAIITGALMAIAVTSFFYARYRDWI